jgi:hypothetical protein
VPLGFGVGDLHTLAPTIEASVISAGLDWAADYEPTTFATWVTWDRLAAYPITASQSFAATCEQVEFTNGLLPPAELLPLAEGDLVTSLVPYLVASQYALGECGAPVVVVADPTYVPPAPIDPTITSFAVYADLVSTPDRRVTDFRADADSDGILEDYSSLVQFILLDGALAEVCSITYDLSDAVEIDPGLLTAPVPLGRAWQFQPADGESDCSRVDPTVFGTVDIDDVFSANPVILAVGPADTITTTDPNEYALYLSFGSATVVEASLVRAIDLDGCYVWDPVDPIHPYELAISAAVDHEALPYYALPF